jgi:hypothetical protein
LSLGTYHSPNDPNAIPATHVQIHHRACAGRLSRTISRTTSAMAHPAVTTPMTSWSLASSGGGGAGRSARSLDCFTRSGYEVARQRQARVRRRADVLREARERDVLTSEPALADEGSR